MSTELVVFRPRWGQALVGRAIDVMILDREPESDRDWEYFEYFQCRLTPGGLVMVDESADVVDLMEALKRSVDRRNLNRLQREDLSHCVECGRASAFIDPLAGMCLTCLNGPVPS